MCPVWWQHPISPHLIVADHLSLSLDRVHAAWMSNSPSVLPATGCCTLESGLTGYRAELPELKAYKTVRRSWALLAEVSSELEPGCVQSLSGETRFFLRKIGSLPEGRG